MGSVVAVHAAQRIAEGESTHSSALQLEGACAGLTRGLQRVTAATVRSDLQATALQQAGEPLVDAKLALQAGALLAFGKPCIHRQQHTRLGRETA